MLNVTVDERIAYFSQRAALSQIRLYGSKFNGSADSANACTVKLPTRRELLLEYLKTEESRMGKYHLIFPSEDYPQQITAGRQPLYDSLLRLAAALFWRGDQLLRR